MGNRWLLSYPATCGFIAYCVFSVVPTLGTTPFSHRQTTHCTLLPIAPGRNSHEPLAEDAGLILVSLRCSDSIFLRTTCVATLEQLPNLQHLSLSRCYQIYAAALGYVRLPLLQGAMYDRRLRYDPGRCSDLFKYFKYFFTFLLYLLYRFSGICEKFPALRLLDAFGLVHDARAFSKTYEMKRVAVNTRALSAVARPTPASVDGRSMWNRRCRLRLHY